MPDDRKVFTIHARVEPQLNDEFENWRRDQSQIPSRSDALRELLKRGLQSNRKITEIAIA
jgi:metal-responsive CopG/Arc/MetJ family transcriptional regulator